MVLTTGTKLGPYEILGPLGAGGMGEVYKARDTRLDRTVAIKVLPDHLSRSPEVKKRFEREARAVSSLNHPNICTLHDVGSDNGTDYLVMEYLEGDTLAKRLEEGPLQVDELLRTAIEIADALDKAHRNGLIHRDLKPGNIMMLSTGGSKLLDFGLARSTEHPSVDTDLTQSPTLSRPLTAEGTIVGTFQYMAPEQLEAVETDARTDVFALGAVIYEMATGRPAFQGKTQASLIASILKEEPPAISEVHPMSPPALDRLVKRCMMKDPDERWQTARDVMLELQWIKEGGSQIGVPATVRSRRKTRERIAWVLVVLLAVAVGTLGIPKLMEPPVERKVGRFIVPPPVGMDINPGQPHMQVSPDGNSAVFVAADSAGTVRLFTQRFETRAARAIPGSEGAGLPFWSPDSRSVAFFTSNGQLARASVDGGRPQIVCEAADGRGGAWSKDDVMLFCPSSGGPLFRAPAGGGHVIQVTRLDTTINEDAHRFPQFLPDGRPRSCDYITRRRIGRRTPTSK